MLKNCPLVLVIESEPEAQHNLTKMLEARYAIDVAKDAATAFILNHQRTADLVLANVMAGNRDGTSLIRELRRDEQFQFVPIIVYASSAGEELCLEAMEAGANDCLIAPFSELQLLARVRAQLRAAQVYERSFNDIRDREERYRTFANAVSMSMWSAAPNGDIVSDAYGWEKMTGQTPDEYKGFGWTAAVHPDDKQRVLEIWQQSLRNKTSHNVEFRVRLGDGGYRHIRARGTPIINPDGSVREWIGAIFDIDERKR